MCATYILEEATSDNLEAHKGEDKHGDTKALGYDICHSLSRGTSTRIDEELRHLTWEEVAYEEGDSRNARSANDGIPEHFDNTIVLAGTIVIAHDRLHTLIEAHGDHHKEQKHAVHNAIGAHVGVADITFEGGALDDIVLTRTTIAQQHGIHEACNKRCAEVQ